MAHVELDKTGQEGNHPNQCFPLHVDKCLYLYVDGSLYFNRISIYYNITQFERANCIYNKKWAGPLKSHVLKVKSPQWIKESPKLSPSYVLVGMERLPQTAAVTRRARSWKPEVSVSTANPASLQ